MELYQLRAFVITAEEGQVTKAAQRLHVSQPAVSAQIKALEQELGIPLFEREASGIVLSRAGQELLAKARSILSASNALMLEGRKLRDGLCHEFRLGTVLHPQFIQLGKLVHELIEVYPLLHIKLRHGISDSVIDGIKNGELDASFFLGNQDDSSIAYSNLAQLAYCVVGPIAWAKQIENATLEQLSELPWLTAPRTSSQTMLLQKLFKGALGLPANIVEVDQETTRLCLVLEGVGVCLMRRELAWQYRRDRKVAIWPHAGPSTTLSFIHAVSRQHESAIEAVKNVVLRLWSQAANTVDLDALYMEGVVLGRREIAELRGKK